MRHVPMIDATAAAALKNVAERCTKQNIRLIITGLKEELRGTLKTSGIEQLVGEENFYENISEAMNHLGNLEKRRAKSA